MFLYDWININSKLQTSQTEGYGLGLLATVSYVLAGIKLGEAELQTENLTGSPLSSNHHPTRKPLSTVISVLSSTTSLLSPIAPSMRHSLMILAICLGGKLTTATICFPIRSVG